MGSGGPRGLQILLSGAKTTRGGFDSHTFPPLSGLYRNDGSVGIYVVRIITFSRERHPAGFFHCGIFTGKINERLSLCVVLMGFFYFLVIPCRLFALTGGPFDVDTRMWRKAVSDTSAGSEVKSTWTMEELKQVLTRETGEGLLEGTSWQREKNGRVAMLCTMLFPGLGQLYNERSIKTVIAAGVGTFYLSRILLNHRYAIREEKIRDQGPRYVQRIFGQDTLVFESSQWTYHNWMAKEYKERKIDWIWWSAGAMVVLILDAYVDAHIHDMKFKLEARTFEGGAGVSFVVNF